MTSASGTPPSSELLQRIKEAVGENGWTDDPLEMAPHLVDERGLYFGKTPLLVRPATTREVAEVVGLCAEARVPIVPQGGNTGLVGASVPFEHGGEILLNLARMNRLREVDAANFTITAEAGCVLEHVQNAALEAGRCFPLSMGSEGSCQIGGAIATNAGGHSVLRFGSARDLVLGLEVVLPDGRILDGLKGLRKDNTGYDLKQLFIGSEGTLGVITAAVLKLFPRPNEVAIALVGVKDPAAAVALLSCAREASSDAVTAFELIPRIAIEFVVKNMPGTDDPLAQPHPYYVLVELSSTRAGPDLGEELQSFLGQAMEDGLVEDAVIATSQAQAEKLWRLRNSLPEAEKREGGSIKNDISLPLSAIAAFIARASAAITREMPGIRVVAFGHVGDGNLHFNLSQPVGADREEFLREWGRVTRIVHDIAAAMGGSISAEHGIGRLKRDDLARYKSALEMELMRRLKAALDPTNMMNPGKVL